MCRVPSPPWPTPLRDKGSQERNRMQGFFFCSAQQTLYSLLTTLTEDLFPVMPFSLQPAPCFRPLKTGLALLLTLAAAPALAADDAANQYLEMDLTQLMQVTITSVGKKNQTLSDTAAAVHVITQEDIQRSGVTSIPEALALAPGLQVARISASKWSISSRGFAGYTSNKLLVLIDGRSVYSPAYSGVVWDMQNTLLEDIVRIPRHPASDSTRRRPRIPRDPGRLFQ